MILLITDHLICDEFPDSIRSQHQEPVILTQVELIKLRLGGDSNRVGHQITNGPAHSKARDVFVLKPDSSGTYWVTILLSERIHTTVTRNDPVMLVFHVRLVIPGKTMGNPYFVRFMTRLGSQSLL